MYGLCVSGALNMQGFVWKVFYAPYVSFHLFNNFFRCFISAYFMLAMKSY